MKPKIPEVFLCSTRFDLSEERELVLDAIRRLQFQHNSMEYFGAHNDPPIHICLNEVAKSDILVVVVGHSYGSYVPNMSISYSEAEYDEGVRLGKPCLVYMRSDDVPILPKFVEKDPEKIVSLSKWKEKLNSKHTVKLFENQTDLALQVMADLSRLASDNNIIQFPDLIVTVDPDNTIFTRYVNENDQLTGNIGLALHNQYLRQNSG